MAPVLPQHRPPTVTLSVHRFHCTEPIGTPIPLLQTLPVSTLLLQAFRQLSDPPVNPPQIYYRAQRWIVIRKSTKTLEMQELLLPDFLYSPMTPLSYISF
uniref:Uncharacterized protein n=1 Tax=Micrurus corallinus TaxID=54390 RepID=A0A2D4H1Z2_MICCO